MSDNNHLHNNRVPRILPKKRSREPESISNVQNNTYLQYPHNNISVPENFPLENLVSTGHTLSYDDNMRILSLPSASCDIVPAPPIFPTSDYSLGIELLKQRDERNLPVPSSGSIIPAAPIFPTPDYSLGIELLKQRDERNLPVPSASGSIIPAAPIFPSLDDTLRFELFRLRAVRQVIQNQASQLRDMNQRHIASFSNTIDNIVENKDQKIDIVNKENMELKEQIKQVEMETENWENRAKYNKSMVDVVKANLYQTINNVTEDQGQEGFGDSELDKTASSSNIDEDENGDH